MKFINRNDLAARKVLAIVKRLAKNSKSDAFVLIETYANYREQGFALSTLSSKVVFSKNHNSDNIVVYFGHSSEFERNSNIPSEDVYEIRKFFMYNEHEKAAKFILRYLER